MQAAQAYDAAARLIRGDTAVCNFPLAEGQSAPAPQRYEKSLVQADAAHAAELQSMHDSGEYNTAHSTADCVHIWVSVMETSKHCTSLA